VKLTFYDNRHLLFVSIAGILVAGVSAFFAIPRLEDPRITNRNPIVLTPVPGASAERVEALVTEPLEEALQEIAEIKEMNSTSRSGTSVISIALKDEIEAGANERVFSKIRDQLADAERLLPPDALSPEVDDERDPVAFTLLVALQWEAEGEPRLGLMTRLAEELADRLRNVDGTELVRLYGDVDEEVTVSFDQEEVRALGLTVDHVAGALRQADAKRSAGTLRTEATDVQLEVEGGFSALDRLRRVPLLDSDGLALAQLGDVAVVERGWDDPPIEIGRSDGRRCVYVGARMSGDAKVGGWSSEALDIVEEARRDFGPGVELSIVFDQSEYTIERLRELALNLLLGVGVVMVVILLTMGFRSALVVGSAIPLVAAATLFGVLLSGGQLHQMSVFGMIIALGLLIDNAIVVVDETRKRIERGMPPRDAVGDTLAHLAGPLFASTLTTTLAFAPIVLLPGNAGDFVGYIGGSVIIAILSSYAISMTIIAALAGRHLRVRAGEDSRRRSWIGQGLPGAAAARLTRKLMIAGLRTPVAMMILSTLPALAGFAVAPHLGNQFFPPVDRDMFDLRVWLPEQTSIERTHDVVASMEETLRDRADVERVHWLVGGSFPSVYYNLSMNQDRASHYAQAVIDATSSETVQRMIPEIQRTLDAEFPGAQVVVRSFGQGPPVDADLVFRIHGPTIDQMQRIGDVYREAMQAHPDVLHTRTSMPRGQPKLWFNANEDEARFAGYSLDALSSELRGQLDGSVGGAVLEDVVELPVRIRAPAGQRRSVAGLASLAFPVPEQRWAPLEAIGSFELRPETASISRFDSRRTNIVEGYTAEDVLAIDVTREVQDALDADGFELPPGYRVELGGELDTNQDAVGNLLQYAPVLAVIMVASLILTFRSVLLACVLVAVAVCSVGLALLNTFFIGFPISFNTILGTFGLIGIAFNDSIVVLAAIRENDRARLGDRAAIADAVLGCSRHVISTTLTTIGGFLPLLLLVGGEFWPSLAIVLAGGVGGATILALVFIPASYVLVITMTRHLTPRPPRALP